MQYLSDESDKVKIAETPDIILVEDDSGDENISKKRHRSRSGSRECKKMMRTERRVVVDMTRDKRGREDLKDKRRDLDRRRDDKIRMREDLKRDDLRKDEKSVRKVIDKIKDDRKDDLRKRIDDDRRKETLKKEELRKREHEKRYKVILIR